MNDILGFPSTRPYHLRDRSQTSRYPNPLPFEEQAAMSELVHPSYLGLQAVGWRVMTGNWWEKVRGLIRAVCLH
jgi:hypothetical protein